MERVRIARLRKSWTLPERDLREFSVHAEGILEPLLDDICMPPFGGPTDHDDYTPLMAIAKSLNCRKIIELGTAYGNTVANLARHCPRAKILTVNAPVEVQTGGAVTFELTREEIGRVYVKYGYCDRIVQIFANTLDLDLAASMEDEPADLAIIDACHDEQFVRNDFSKVMPFVSRGGFVVFHDTHPCMQNHLYGSYAACMGLRKDGFDICHLRDTWWGIWQNV